MVLDDIFKKTYNQKELTREDAVSLFDIKNGSEDYYKLISAANSFSRKQFKNRGRVFAQIGIDSQPCSANCKFCSLGIDNYTGDIERVKSIDEVLIDTKVFLENGLDELFLMTTADFNQDLFLQYVKEVKKILPSKMNFVANIGDFDVEYALHLKELGVTGVYHICRLNEGEDTCINLDTRIKTLDAIKESGMELYYCVEPIGPEHSNEQIITEIFRAKEYPVKVMATMKRVSIPGSQIYSRGEITSATLAKITAIATLCVRPERAMGVHEPNELCLIAGANQIYAERGSNPRDRNLDTEKNRGFSVNDAKGMLKNTDWL